MAVRVYYDNYVQTPGAAKDIGAGTDGSVWVIGTVVAPGGFTIHKWNGTGWDLDSNGASSAVRISVSPDGTPWVANSGGFVYHKSSNSPFSGVWQLVSGISASDIAGMGSTAYAVSTTATTGGFTIYYFDGGQWVLDNNGAVGGVRIAVDNFGVPWIVQSSGAILLRYEGGWTSMPLGYFGLHALDIAVPPNAIAGYAWAVNGFTGSLLLNLFNQQFAYPGPPGLNAPSDTEWWPTTFRSTFTTSASVAAAGPNGQPWIVDGAGNIFRSTIP